MFGVSIGRDAHNIGLEHLKTVRSFELQTIMALIRQEAPVGARVLDIGAGTGWQAQMMADAGYAVEAIDLPTSTYVNDRAFPIRDYDGCRIPFPEATFDVVCSSNVLEHVTHAVAFQSEIRRVLRPAGLAIHVVPSATWRFWSNLAHYPYIARRLVEHFSRGEQQSSDHTAPTGRTGGGYRVTFALKRALISHRDGEVGNALTEIYHFSRWRWQKLFRSTGWKIESRVSNRLFYTAYYLLGIRLSVAARSRVSRLLGSSCHVFVLRPEATYSARRAIGIDGGDDGEGRST
jgi:SAM-dependent methyltransferase